MPVREQLLETLQALRCAHVEVLASMPVAEIVDGLDRAAALLERTLQPPLPMRPGFDRLIASLRREALWRLLESELGDPLVLDGFRPRPAGGYSRAAGPPVIAHVFAGNTPLLAWPSLALALLAKSAALGKTARGQTEWPERFVEAVRGVHRDLGRCLALMSWPGGTRELDAALCTGADALVAYGSDAALADLRALTPAWVPFHGHGHRVSIGLVLQGASRPEAAMGLARDVLLYDQEGCLSVACVFLEGSDVEAASFAASLAEALATQAEAWRVPPRTGPSAAAARAARQAALFAPEARCWGDPDLRWSVLCVPGASIEPSCGACVVPVHPLPDLTALPGLLAPLRAHLQGAALAAPAERVSEAATVLARCGVSRICPPGDLQSPPLAWHSDGRPVLASLVHWTDLDLETDTHAP